MGKKITNIISAKSVAADYGNGDVISGINFDVKPGEAFGLMGLNGAGKTTFIKILLGLLEPSKGSVSIDGKSGLSIEVKNKIAYLPEKFEPPSFLNGYEFVRFCLKLYKKTCTDKDIHEIADRLALDQSALKRRVNTYSKGMRQKIGLIATFLTECPIMILDEPMSGLDPRARARVKDEILNCKKKKITTFVSSHILADMDEICNRVSVLHEGELKFLGTPNSLKTKTSEEYLERAFLKLIEGRVKKDSKPKAKKKAYKKQKKS